MKVKEMIMGLILIATSNAFAADPPQSPPAEMIKARNDYQRTLNEAKLAKSKIAVDEAEILAKRAAADKDFATAEYYRARSAYLRDYHNVMLQEYARVQTEEANMKQRMYEIRVHQDMCGELAEGSTRRGAFQCLQYFRRYVVNFGIQKKLFFDDKIEALPASEFVANYSDLKALPFPGGNLGQLLVFAEKNELSFNPYGKAHSFVMGFLEAIGSAAQAKINEYRNWIDGIRAGTLDVFKLPPA